MRASEEEENERVAELARSHLLADRQQPFPTADAPLTRGRRRLATVAPETWDRLVSLVLGAGEATGFET